jgi:ubiquinone biosynthesis protein
MDLLHGQRLDQAGLDPEQRAEAARLLATSVLDQVLVHGFFHADPHFGNLLVSREPDGVRLALLDWGLVGRLTPRMRYLVGDMLSAVVAQDAPGMVRVLTEMGVAPGTGENPALAQDLEDLLERVHSVPLGQIDTAGLLMELMEISRRNHTRLQVQYALMQKTFMEMEGVCRELDPGMPFTLSPSCIAFLREKVAGDYLVMSDDLASKVLKETYGLGETVVRAFQAGVDVLLVCGHEAGDMQAAHAALLEAVRSGEITEEDLDARLAGILRLKQKP